MPTWCRQKPCLSMGVKVPIVFSQMSSTCADEYNYIRWECKYSSNERTRGTARAGPFALNWRRAQESHIHLCLRTSCIRVCWSNPAPFSKVKEHQLRFASNQVWLNKIRFKVQDILVSNHLIVEPSGPVERGNENNHQRVARKVASKGLEPWWQYSHERWHCLVVCAIISVAEPLAIVLNLLGQHEPSISIHKGTNIRHRQEELEHWPWRLHRQSGWENFCRCWCQRLCRSWCLNMLTVKMFI